ncbi:MAG: hypothetical protein V9H69_23675 [Anaerolineae bacterium]
MPGTASSGRKGSRSRATLSRAVAVSQNAVAPDGSGDAGRGPRRANSALDCQPDGRRGDHAGGQPGQQLDPLGGCQLVLEQIGWQQRPVRHLPAGHAHGVAGQQRQRHAGPVVEIEKGASLHRGDYTRVVWSSEVAASTFEVFGNLEGLC